MADAGAFYGAEADAITTIFRMKLASLRRRLRPWEMAAAVRALREEKQAALRAMRERKAIDRRANLLAQGHR